MKDDVVIVLIDASLFLYFGDNGSSRQAIHATGSKEPGAGPAGLPARFLRITVS